MILMDDLIYLLIIVFGFGDLLFLIVLIILRILVVVIGLLSKEL